MALKKTKRGGRRAGSGRKPGVQNKVTRALKEMASEYTERALDVLVEVMEDPEAPHAARVAAADKVLDRGHGRPAITVDATLSDTLGPDMLKRLETEMMERMARARARQQAVLIERRIDDEDDQLLGRH
ncbi:MAG: hypothetical protein ACXWUD_10890 [Methylosarcina sp.]